MACGTCSQKQAKVTYAHTDTKGVKTVYKTEVEAKAAVARKGGKYVRQ